MSCHAMSRQDAGTSSVVKTGVAAEDMKAAVEAAAAAGEVPDVPQEEEKGEGVDESEGDGMDGDDDDGTPPRECGRMDTRVHHKCRRYALVFF